jgi:hypothetical protein
VLSKDYCYNASTTIDSPNTPTLSPTAAPVYVTTPEPTATQMTQSLAASEPELSYTGLCAEGSCEVCEGECGKDADCGEGLACFQRDDLTPISGSSGSGISGVDSCYLPQDPALMHNGDCSSESPCGFCEGPGFLCIVILYEIVAHFHFLRQVIAIMTMNADLVSPSGNARHMNWCRDVPG